MASKEPNPLVFLTTTQVAKILGISRVAILKRIRAKKIHAQKVGRNYVISIDEFRRVIGEYISPDRKKQIDNVVQRVVREYRETFRLLGLE